MSALAGLAIATFVLVASAPPRAVAATPSSVDPDRPPIQEPSAVASRHGTAPRVPTAGGGDLDPSFSGDGRVTTGFAGDGGEGYDLALAPGGEVVVSGNHYFPDFDTEVAVVRYRPDGTPDPAFSGDGKVSTDVGECEFHDGGVAVQPDGKIVVAAGIAEAGSGDCPDLSTDIALVRYNANGTLDGSFGAGGIATTGFDGEEYPFGLALQPDGKIVVAGQLESGGSRDMFLARFRADGTLDPTFGGNGSGGVRIVLDGAADARGVAIQPDGRIVAAGSVWSNDDADFLLARLLPGGTLDTTFGGGGVAQTSFGTLRDIPSGVTLQRDGTIVAGGHSGRTPTRDGDFALAGYRPNGTLDPSFGDGGGAITDFGAFDWAEAIAIGPDDEIALAGWSDPFGPLAVARYRPNGSLDPDFGDGGGVRTWTGASAEGVAIQPDGRIVAGGWADGPTFAAARFLVASESPPPPPPPEDTEVALRIKGKKRLRVNRRRVAKLRLRCPAREASPPCRGKLKLKTRKRIRFKGKRRKVNLARKRFRIDAGETKRVKLRLSRRKARLVRKRRKARRARAIARVRDGAGNRDRVRKRLVLRPR